MVQHRNHVHPIEALRSKRPELRRRGDEVKQCAQAGVRFSPGRIAGKRGRQPRGRWK